LFDDPLWPGIERWKEMIDAGSKAHLKHRPARFLVSGGPVSFDERCFDRLGNHADKRSRVNEQQLRLSNGHNDILMLLCNDGA